MSWQYIHNLDLKSTTVDMYTWEKHNSILYAWSELQIFSQEDCDISEGHYLVGGSGE